MRLKINVNMIIFLLMLIQAEHFVFGNLQSDIRNKLRNENSTSLSRTRRYLVFPEGSSFQVVFDLVYPAEAIQGNVFTFGNTAAMAWELPSTPIFLDKKWKKEEKEEKVETTTMEPVHKEHLDHSIGWETNWQAPLAWDDLESSDWNNDNDRSSIMYYRNPLSEFIHQQNVQPDIKSLNYEYPGTYRSNFYNRNPTQFWSRRNVGRSLLKPTLKKANSSEKINRTVAHHIQRRSRRDLYSKVEKLLTALSKDGKSCVLKAICQVHQLSSKKGSMWEEIIKAIFRSKHDMYPDEDHYDRAANKSHDCDQLYPDCDGHVLSNLFRNTAKKKNK